MNLISLAAGVVPEASPIETVEAAAAGGFDMVGLLVAPTGWTGQTTREIQTALADAGLPLLDVEVVWLKPETTLDSHRKILDVGAQLGAANVLCVSSHVEAQHTAAELRALCEHAEGTSLRIALEFGIFTEVKDGPAALSIIERVDHPAAALLIDPIHVDRSDTSAAWIAGLDPHLLAYAQFCDASATRPPADDFDAIIVDAIDLREQCGEGSLPLDAIYAALPSGVPLSMELRSKALRDAFPDLGERARAIACATRAWLERHTQSRVPLATAGAV